MTHVPAPTAADAPGRADAGTGGHPGRRSRRLPLSGARFVLAVVPGLVLALVLGCLALCCCCPGDGHGQTRSHGHEHAPAAAGGDPHLALVVGDTDPHGDIACNDGPAATPAVAPVAPDLPLPVSVRTVAATRPDPLPGSGAAADVPTVPLRHRLCILRT